MTDNVTNLYNQIVDNKSQIEPVSIAFVTPSDAYNQFIEVIKTFIPNGDLLQYIKQNSDKNSIEDYFTPEIMFRLAYEQLNEDCPNNSRKSHQKNLNP